MKLIFTLLLFALTFFFHTGSQAQTYTVTSNNQSWASLVSGGTCNNCTINIPAGWTLLLNSSGTCNGCTFNNGTVNITSGFTFNNNATNFNSDTVLFNTSTSGYTFHFNNDSVAVNASVSSQNGTSTVSGSRFAIGASLTFNAATLTNDSMHLNNALKINNSPANFSGSHISLTTNGTISTPASTFTNSVLAFAGNSNLTVSNAMTMDGSSFYLQGNAYAKAASITMQNNSSVVMTGSNSFQSSNALTMTSSSITMSSTSTASAASLTAASSAITTNDNTQFNISNAISLTGTTLKMNGASIVKGASATVQTSSSLTMTGSAALTVSNGLDINASTVALKGNSSISDNTTTVENNSNFVVGDGTLAGTAHLSTTNTLQVLDNSLLKISNGNNYFYSNASSFTGGSSAYTIKPNTISCDSGATTGYANSCTSGYVYGCATLNSSGALACTVLAIADIALTATVTGTDAVTLSWTDANNAKEDYFQVQRSTGSLDWTTIGTLTANGYAAGDYQFNDAAAAAGSNSYRVKVIDKAGRVLYSNVSAVTLIATPESIHIYPNPVTGHTFFVRTASTRPVLVNLFTLSGQLLSRTSLEGQTQYSMKLPASMLPGNYMVVQVIGTESTQAFNLLVQ